LRRRARQSFVVTTGTGSGKSLCFFVPIIDAAIRARAIRWEMPRLLGIAIVLGLFSIVESFGLLWFGIRALTHPDLQDYFGLTNGYQLQTVMFLQLVAGGHLVLFITRTERWFFLPPFPAPALFIAIVLTQILAVLMCGFGLLVPPIPWTLIGWVWAYNIAWMFVLGGVRLITERFAAYRTARHSRSVDMVNQSLRLHAAA
jgi:H+-transporting ATPase